MHKDHLIDSLESTENPEIGKLEKLSRRVDTVPYNIIQSCQLLVQVIAKIGSFNLHYIFSDSKNVTVFGIDKEIPHFKYNLITVARLQISTLSLFFLCMIL